MITLLSPLALVGLVALALPLLIHLLRRPDRPVVEFAALRWLREHPLRKPRWRWHEQALLLLRLALMAAVVLLMAQPVWQADAPLAPEWVVVAPGMDLAAVRASGSAAALLRWLAPGFPVIGASASGAFDAFDAPNAARPGIASLIRQLDADLPPATPLTVVVPAELAGLDAERLRLHRPVHWRIVGAASTALPAGPTKLARLQVAIRSAEPVASGAGAPEVATGSEEIAVARVLVAAWQVEPSSGWQVDLDQGAGPVPAATQLLFWLGGNDFNVLSRWLESGGTALASRRECGAAEPMLRDADGEPLLHLQRHGRGRLLCLATALTPEATPPLRDAAFPRRLFEAVTAGIEHPAPDRAFAAAVAPVPAGGTPLLRTPRSIDAAWLVCVAALFAAERWWATRRRLRPDDPPGTP